MPRRNQPSTKVTVHSVAERAGVSIATVSRVMSNNPSVNPEMAERVRRAASELGYRPSASAQGLASGRTQTVGLVVPNLGNPYFSDLIKSVASSAGAEGYRLLVADSNEHTSEELDLAQSLLRGADGLILVSPRLDRSDLVELGSNKHPVVLVNRVEVGVGLPSVSVDNYSAMLDLAGHLVQMGHRKIVYMSGPELSWQENERRRAVQQIVGFGVELAIVNSGGTTDEGYAATDEAWLHQPSAIMCFNDLCALGVVARLGELGIRVPDQVSVTGFDDISFAKYASPRLTTAVSPQGELGRRAWELMRQVLDGRTPPTPDPLRAPIVVRESVRNLNP